MHLAHHFADDGQLLEVFLAKVGAVGLHHVEQLAHHLAHSVEVAGAVLALHHRVQRGIAEAARIRLGIDFLHRWGEGYRGAALVQQSAVGLQRTRIFL